MWHNHHVPDADRLSARPQSGLSHLNHRSASGRGAEEGRSFESLADAHVQARGLTSARQRWLSTTRYALQAVELMLAGEPKFI
jgi:hypothetical protein